MAFGHRRLAVLDLSETGHQPMTSASGRYVICFNGEVYNHPELRKELEQIGHAFRGTSDTEVLLGAIDAWGLEGALLRCNAMFALALWDRTQRKLSLARDRLGEKPLFYGTAGDDLVFASELKALRRHPGFLQDVDRQALALYLRHTYVPAPHCIYRDASKLPAGTILTVDPRSRGSLPEPEPFWSLREIVDQGAAARRAGHDAVDALDELVADAVRLRLQADVPVGAFLSGGIDSSLVVAMAQAHGSSRPVRTFTVAMPDLQLDESTEAAAVAAHLGTDHSSVELSATEALGLIPQLPVLYDEPFSDPSQLPTLLLSRAARQHVTVALSGDGGDESFGGYNRHVFGPRAWRRMRHVPPAVRTTVARAVDAVSPEHWDVIGRRAAVASPRLAVRNLGDKAHKLARLLRVADEHAMYLCLASQWDEAAAVTGLPAEPLTAADDVAALPATASPAEQMLYLDTTMALADGMLCKVDRASMAASLEVRVPLLDHRIVELAWRLPMSMKVKGTQGKWILRQLLDRYLPRELVDRPKMGFDPPIGAWLRGPLRKWGDELLDSRRMHEQGWLDAKAVRTRWDEHQRGVRRWDYHLWTVLQFQSWLEA